MATTTIPDAIDALFAGLTAAMPGVQVLDGPAVGVTLKFDHVIVGGPADDDAVSGEQVPGGIGAQRRRETYAIRCQAGAYAQGGTQKAVRDIAAAHLAAIEAWVRANATLSGVVRYAQVGGAIALDQRPPTETNDAGDEVVLGRKAVWTFDVVCTQTI